MLSKYRSFLHAETYILYENDINFISILKNTYIITIHKYFR
jgi:hypothetical protein